MTLTFYRTPLIAQSGSLGTLSTHCQALSAHKMTALVDLIKVTLVNQDCFPGALNVAANDGFGIQESVA